VGCPGILNAARVGNVTIANAIGQGVADDKLTLHLCPGAHRVLPRRAAAAVQRHDLPARRSGRPVGVPGPARPGWWVNPVRVRRCGHRHRAACLRRRRWPPYASRCSPSPRAWIAQEWCCCPTAPAKIGDQLLPRHFDLRAVRGQRRRADPAAAGGLTRVALREGSLIVNSSQGGGFQGHLGASPLRPSALSEAERVPDADGPSAFPGADGTGHRTPTVVPAASQSSSNEAPGC
jgi:hypothetical protein